MARLLQPDTAPRRPVVARQVVVQREDAKEKAKAALLARGVTLSDEDLGALVGQ